MIKITTVTIGKQSSIAFYVSNNVATIKLDFHLSIRHKSVLVQLFILKSIICNISNINDNVNSKMQIQSSNSIYWKVSSTSMQQQSSSSSTPCIIIRRCINVSPSLISETLRFGTYVYERENVLYGNNSLTSANDLTSSWDRMHQFVLCLFMN